MRTRLFSIFFALSISLPFLSFELATAQRRSRLRPTAAAAASNIPAPQEVLGFTPGDDRKLASWNQVLAYFDKLDRASDRVKFEALGKTTMDKPFVMATISAPENLARLDEYRKIQDLLADPRKLGPPRLRARKAAELIQRGKTIVLITCGIHSTEVGSYLSSLLIAHRLASSNEPEIREILRNTIILLVPSLNPDGVDIVKNWYDKTLGTPYEGTSPPELYHKYVGHDNNRDWYAFTQVETKITVDKIHNFWHPQIVHDIHQQGEYGSRLFLPPYMPPVEPNVPKQIVEGYTALGSYMARELRAKGFQGITTNSTYDAWTPARAYSHYHGGVRILSETASARLATPITLRFDQLRSREGYNPQKESDKFGPVWRGGEWHLRDISNYMTTAAFTLLTHASQNREAWLRRFFEIGQEAVRPRKNGELWGFRVKASENTVHLLDILNRAGVEYGWPVGQKRVTIPLSLNSPEMTYPGETILVPLAQPYGGFAKALLERQHYPNLRDSAGHPISPYDVTAHTLPLLLGTEVTALSAPFKATFPRKINISRSTGDCESSPRRPIAVYKSHMASMDEGWTRWVLQRAWGPCSENEEIMDEAVRAGRFEQRNPVPGYLIKTRGFENLRYKTIIIPDQSPAAILNGYRPGSMPAEYTGGLGAAGVKALREFVEQGGTLVCLNRASSFAIEQFKLPLRDIVAKVPEKEFFVPGSILRIELDTSHPMVQGMPKDTIAWVEDSPVFEVVSGTGVPPVAEEPQDNTGRMPPPQVRVIARYPLNKNPLLSGWLLGEHRIRGKAALVEVTLGKGRIILFGFRPQYRAQSLATYPLLFNAIRSK